MRLSRQRRLAKLLLSAAFTCILVLVLSLRFFAGTLITSHKIIFVDGGELVVVCSQDNLEPAVKRFTGCSGPLFITGSRRASMTWWFEIDPTAPDPFITIPLWLPTVLLGIPGAILLYRTRPTRHGLCPRCKYNLTGLPESFPCPECGRIPVQKGA